MNSLIITLLKALLLTVTVECIVSVFFGIRKPGDLLLVMLVNVMTNPLVNIILDVLYYKAPYMINVFTVLVVEVGVVIVEALMYNGRLKCGKMSPLLLSFILNGASFSAGALISLL